MNRNFRSDKEILDFVNKVFETLFEPQDKDALIKANYKATFEDSDKLDPSSEDRAKGSVEFLISHEDGYDIQENQWKNIAKFIKAIKDDKIEGYEEVKKRLKADEKAIGIVFDSKTKMLELKKELNALGLECKVSATENFYHTKEINDIFLVLKSCEILNRKKKQLAIKDAKSPVLYESDKFYIAGALRGNIVQYDEKQVLELFDGEFEDIIKVFDGYISKLNCSKISETIKYIVDSSNLLETYLYIGDIAQRAANIEKLIQDTIAFEQNIPNDLFAYLSDLERNIYFLKDIKEDEAFYQSSNVESIELCTIHSTKGLAYPMIILAQSEKGLHANASGEMGLSFNSFAINEQGTVSDYSAIGFKIDEYEPLIYRALKKISINKHEAEKKRLLYVALTRAEHNLIISGSMYDKEVKPTKKNPEPDRVVADISDNSYLGWMVNKVFDLEKDDIFNRVENEHIKFIDTNKFKDISGETVNPLDYAIKEYQEQNVILKQYNKKTASNSGQDHKANEHLAAQAKIGTAIHSILERYWDKIEDQSTLDRIYFKYKILDIDSKQKIEKYLDTFKTTTTYTALKSGVEHHFELELNKIQDDKWTQGIIDLVYFDKEKDGWVIVDFKSNNIEKIKDLEKFAKDNDYDKQLETYQELCESKGMNVIGKMLLFLDSGKEVMF
jgi:ATP-dependent exoDNAse (exonuclease V) beta subunit